MGEKEHNEISASSVTVAVTPVEDEAETLNIRVAEISGINLFHTFS